MSSETSKPAGMPRGETCPTCRLSGWEAKQVTGWIEATSIENARLREALEYLADPDSWNGDPCRSSTWIYGHFTPHEIACRALGRSSSADQVAAEVEPTTNHTENHDA